MRVSCHICCRGRESAVQSIRSALLSAGVETLPPDAAGSSAGLLLFETASSAVCGQVRDLTFGGRERLLAVASGPAPSDADAWELLGAGASDVIVWHDPEASARAVAARFARWAEVDRLITSSLVQEQLAGRTHVWLSALRQLVEAASFTAAPLLITGESGTGKEAAARLVHALDRRSDKRQFVVLDCSTLVPQLSGSEFFGHERGSFTGAVAPRDGAFELANGGTLFLDEVGELSPEMQAQLLRVVQEHTYKRVGSNSWKRTNFRLVCATNRDLLADIAAGRFRADLYYRLAGVCCHLPPLRDRLADLPLLIDHFLAQFGGGTAGIDEAVMRLLLAREYRGNVRELRQIVTRMIYRHVGPGPLSVGDVPEEERRAPSSAAAWQDEAFRSAIGRAVLAGVGLKEIGRVAEDTAEHLALEQEGGVVHLAAVRLGISDRALQLRRAARRDKAAAADA